MIVRLDHLPCHRKPELPKSTVKWACAEAAERHGLEIAVLSGGVFQNRRLLERIAELLAAAGLRPLVPERLPPDEGGIAYGQAAVAAARDCRG
jgi:hydrogenase maturation protein HypF